MGDSVIPLPYLQSLRRLLPETSVDFLTRQENSGIPRSVKLFDHVHELGGGRNFKAQSLHAVAMLPRLLLRRYDVVLDLQNNEISRMVRRALHPAAWSEFDRTSPITAGERTSAAIDALRLGTSQLETLGAESRLTMPDDALGLARLRDAGWDGESDLIVLNPAGFYITRNWPLRNLDRGESVSSPRTRNCVGAEP